MAVKWVVFDFCETLVNLQSADAFIAYVIKGKMKFWRRLWSGVILIFQKCRFFVLAQKMFPIYNLEKRMRMFLLRGISKADLDVLANEFVNTILVPAENAALVSRMKAHLAKGDKVQISSGGIGVYLRFWSSKYGIETVDATELEYRDNRCTGFMLGRDCLYGEKVQRLNGRLHLDSALTNLERVSYSDSITDLPLLNWANEAWVVSYDKGRSWVKNYNLKELVIGRNNGGLEI